MKTNIHFWYLTQYFSEWEMFQANVVEKIKAHFVFSNFFFFLIVPFMRKCRKILLCGAGHRWRYGMCTLHAWYLRLQVQTPRLFNTRCLSCYVMRTAVSAECNGLFSCVGISVNIINIFLSLETILPDWYMTIAEVSLNKHFTVL